MGGTTNYDQIRSKFRTIKPPEQKALDAAGDFPNCKGLYPDCPTIPNITESMCRSCPKTEGIERPKIKKD